MPPGSYKALLEKSMRHFFCYKEQMEYNVRSFYLNTLYYLMQTIIFNILYVLYFFLNFAKALAYVSTELRKKNV